MHPGVRRTPLIAALLVLALLVIGCAGPLAGSAVAERDVVRGEVDTSILRGGDGGEIDRLAAATVLDVQAFWQQAYQPAFGAPWQGLRGGFHSVDTADQQAPLPPCVDDLALVEGNAYYCPEADVVGWDRAALLPVLSDEFGDAAIVVVLAHEIGHAVHHRLGLDFARQRTQPERFPTILFEAIADCFAGAFVRWVTDGRSEHLSITSGQLDAALGALVTLRDPVGTDSADSAAHGNAFDRVSSFQDGYQRGPQLCAGMTIDNRRFTQQQFLSLADQARGGNLPFGELVEAVRPDLDTFFGGVVTANGARWQAPSVRAAPDGASCGGAQGPAAFCPDGAPGSGAVEIDPDGDLRELHDEFGDYATATLLATRYGLAALRAMGRPTEGPDAGRAAVCLAGAYTGTVLARGEGFGLSPGDLDEAVFLLLRDDYGGRDAAGAVTGSGFDRVAAFRGGTVGGPDGCGPG